MNSIYQPSTHPPPPKILLLVIYSTVYPAVFAIVFLFRLLFPTSTPSTNQGTSNNDNIIYSSPRTQGVVVFQFENSLVYIKPPANYQTAIEVAQKEFQELQYLSPDRIAFHMEERMNSPRRIRISESAWGPCVQHSNPPPETIHITTVSDVNAGSAPPRYLDASSMGSNKGRALSWK